jgi:PAS domain S-box-containing protein
MQDKLKDLFESRFQRLRTENKELREKLASQKKENTNNLKSLTRNEMILNAMPVGLAIIQDGKVLKINDTFMEYLGSRSEDIMGAGFLDFIHPAERDQIAKIHKLWDSGRMSPDQYDARLITAEGAPLFCDIKCKRIKFQNRTAFLLVVHCLMERLELEQKNHTGKKAEALITMAAGVKNHLNPFNDMILQTIQECRSAIDSGSKSLEGLFAKLEGASRKALVIMNGLEIIAETEKSKPVPLLFNLNEAVKGAVQSANRTCKEWLEIRGIKLTLKTYLRSTLLIEGDFKRVKDAISEIINNALEAMPEGGDIHITTEDNNGDAHIYIQDCGTGLPEKYKDRICDPFFTTKEGAIGLGLSLACSIIKSHGGHIELESSDAEGTIFHLRFPLAGQKTGATSKGCRKKIADSQIMIVQENDVAREVLSHLLKIKGCRITKLNNALEALGSLKKKSFDMVIADQTALNVDRMLFIEKARKIVPGLSIAIITGDNIDSDSTPLYSQDADLYIRKPVDVDLAVKHISDILSSRK